MAKQIKALALICTAATVASVLLYLWLHADLLLTLSITLGTTAYHFDMRLLAGTVIHRIFRNRMDYTKRWFQPKRFEDRLYTFLRVKQWKRHMPTYNPTFFSAKDHTPEEIVGAMCQAEIVHEVVVLLSFLPLLTVPLFGALPVFLLTSLLAAGIDLLFVVMQRFNRPRVLRLMAKMRQ